MLAKFGRILTIGEELSELCSDENLDRPNECQGLEIPSTTDEQFQRALARLRSGVEVWINGTAETPFVYDGEWGGLVSCGCDFDSRKGSCQNQFPNCPAFYDPGLNFGNGKPYCFLFSSAVEGRLRHFCVGFTNVLSNDGPLLAISAYYNDHHFHLGYHIYAAAVVSHFDPVWGRDHFEQVLLLIRDIANPSSEDSFFPTFRHKDWYQGSSWASGIAVSPLNGRNQESSSEAIASYEAIALYGKEMVRLQNYDNHR